MESVTPVEGTCLSNRNGAAVSKSWKRLDGVDLIRGLAILFVLMNHVNMQLLFAHVPYTKGLPAQLVSSLVWNGQYGVQMFFAVSGFLITATSLRRWGSLRILRPRDFYLLRFARIAPLLLLLLVVLSTLHLAHVDAFVIKKKVAGLGTALLAALTFRINVLEATRGYLPGNWDILWSLSVEEMFYLFFPLACLLFKQLRVFIAVLSIFIVLGPFGRTVLAHGNEVWREYSYLGSMDAIALGSLTALLVNRVRLQRNALWSLGMIGSGLVLFILMFSIKAGSWGLQKSGLDMTVLAVGTCMLIAVAAETRWRSPAALAPLCWLGQRSYEIYLSHMFIVVALFGVYLRLGKPLRAVPAVFLAVIVVAGVLGDLVARFYSEPMNLLLRRLFGDDARSMGAVADVDQTAEPLGESQSA
jgi:peptidoglycan/LPS O-acetylase OafA/YrhL